MNIGVGLARRWVVRYSMSARLSTRSGRPLVWFSASRSVTAPHAAGSRPSSWPIVSPSDSLPSATSDSATAPLNALAVLATRIRSVARTGRRVPSRRTPAA